MISSVKIIQVVRSSDQIVLQSDHHCLGAAGRIELREHIAHMKSDRGAAYDQSFSDVGIV